MATERARARQGPVSALMADSRAKKDLCEEVRIARQQCVVGHGERARRSARGAVAHGLQSDPAVRDGPTSQTQCKSQGRAGAYRCVLPARSSAACPNCRPQ
ncbi:hypothetical protein ERJ75_000615600 [Trypanosoma vivax]|nr:hypothetical protein ERJ75_000615600 [Trypanosoma vivax]